MEPTEANITHVSDTALMVAACRAMETANPDGLVDDPFAALLAGPRGMAIAQALPRVDIMCFGIGIRSLFLDELVRKTIAGREIATVLSLGSGLDTRPFRLDVPPHLRWIEVDFPEMLRYKTGALAGERPKCQVERIPADLNDPAQRRAVFASTGSAPALMITEGLLMYLPAQTVESLAAEAYREGGIRHWLLDVTSLAFARRARLETFQSVENVRAPDHLEGAQILDAIERNGWTATERRTYAADAWAAAQKRILAMMASRPASDPPPPPPDPSDPSGVHLFGKA